MCPRPSSGATSFTDSGIHTPQSFTVHCVHVQNRYRLAPMAPCRPRKPSTPKLASYDSECRNARVEVLFDGEAWYPGTIKEFSAVTEKHLIRYDDGDAKW